MLIIDCYVTNMQKISATYFFVANIKSHQLKDGTTITVIRKILDFIGLSSYYKKYWDK